MIGLGTDIIKTSRIEAALSRHGDRFVHRILSAGERVRYRPGDVHFLAKSFAAKEAVAKALGTGFREGIGWRHIIIERDTLGAPVVRLEGAAAKRLIKIGGKRVLLSIADEYDCALAHAAVV
ncbi:holo-(acyl-carrier-protein) synthase [Luminiphilus syltensis NOR5-1B]|uniref:Holo-[acyl-carrier-protein] synthase n=1 Tax=Luminiphilus syltensis NOR5-1B TaxID=565045 RepID=B8KRH1_9GAMM|nr:holo-ACP synthase [Luminiphilus syltensis]EED34247.1 holo-(acyl-carrier-protein) synthase [Luminiphilus syltensis NOR5-1B]